MSYAFRWVVKLATVAGKQGNDSGSNARETEPISAQSRKQALLNSECSVVGPKRKGGADWQKCNVNGCGKQRKGNVIADDAHAVAGPRCIRHGAVGTHTKCNVDGCGKQRQGNVLSADEHGVAGPRCIRHGAVVAKCNVGGCGDRQRGKVLSDDDHGVAGPRCNLHGAATIKCNVYGCDRAVISRVEWVFTNPFAL